MMRSKCYFCGYESKEEGEDPFEALDKAMRVEGFHRIDIPYPAGSEHVGARVRLLCANCSEHTKNHFIPQQVSAAKVLTEGEYKTPEDVLVPLVEDKSFEEDQNW